MNCSLGGSLGARLVHVKCQNCGMLFNFREDDDDA